MIKKLQKINRKYKLRNILTTYTHSMEIEILADIPFGDLTKLPKIPVNEFNTGRVEKVILQSSEEIKNILMLNPDTSFTIYKLFLLDTFVINNNFNTRQLKFKLGCYKIYFRFNERNFYFILDLISIIRLSRINIELYCYIKELSIEVLSRINTVLQEQEVGIDLMLFFNEKFSPDGFEFYKRMSEVMNYYSLSDLRHHIYIYSNGATDSHIEYKPYQMKFKFDLCNRKDILFSKKMVQLYDPKNQNIEVLSIFNTAFISKLSLSTCSRYLLYHQHFLKCFKWNINLKYQTLQYSNSYEVVQSALLNWYRISKDNFNVDMEVSCQISGLTNAQGLLKIIWLYSLIYSTRLKQTWHMNFLIDYCDYHQFQGWMNILSKQTVRYTLFKLLVRCNSNLAQEIMASLLNYEMANENQQYMNDIQRYQNTLTGIHSNSLL